MTNPVAGRGPSPVSLTLVAMVLGLVAGFVDAVGYLHVVNVFPANQSGNVAFLGLSLGRASPAPGWGPPLAIGAVMGGAAQIAALAVASFAMGVETDVIRSVAGVAVSTTYLSGAIARIGETIASPPGSRERQSERRLFAVLSGVLVART